MDEERKRYLIAGMLVGTVTVGLFVLSRRVPRDQWAETLGRIGRDALQLAKIRYGDNEMIRMLDRTIDNAVFYASAKEPAIEQQ